MVLYDTKYDHFFEDFRNFFQFFLGWLDLVVLKYSNMLNGYNLA